ncbi:MAG: aspartyl-phosphate phosphatase Spo0E family protein [Bacillota bacterium]
MIKLEIENLRYELNQMISNNENYDDIYRISTELDYLIAQFYKNYNECIREEA